MHIFSLMRLARRAFVMNIAGDDGSTGGGAVAAPAAPLAEPVGTAAPASAPATPAAPDAAGAAPAGSAAAAPKTMLEAITRATGGAPPQADPNQPGGQPRDPQGRFATKPGEAPAQGAQPGQPAAAKPAVDPNKPAEAAPEDLLQMPEGLQPKAQERFSRLATANRELTQKFEQAEQQVGYIRDTFEQHGVKREQFEQAVGVIGMLNKGDFDGARRVLEAQLQQIALHTGKPIGTVDALANCPDLRQAVDGMQITEAHALELARGRMQQHQQQEHTQRQQQADQAQQQTRQAAERGLAGVDAFCKQMAATDVDYPAIEAHLLPEIPNLIKGVPPAAWKGVIETQYRLMKRTAAAARQSGVPAAGGGNNSLRPTGSGSPQNAPKSMFEAMWNRPQPSA